MRIYTDGSCNPNEPDKRGGWCAIVEGDKGHPEHIISGNAAATTSQRMEVWAILQAIKQFVIPYQDSPVEIITDSAYAKGVIMDGWKRRKNQDLWALFDREADGCYIKVTHVNGHTGVRLNEMADKEAVRQRKRAPRIHPNSVLIAGSRHLGRQGDDVFAYINRLVQRVKENNWYVIVGDNPNGVDAMVLAACNKQGVECNVYGPHEQPRIIDPIVKGCYMQVETEALSGFEMYHERDVAMSCRAERAMFIAVNDSRGTMDNYNQMSVLQDKDVWVKHYQ